MNDIIRLIVVAILLVFSYGIIYGLLTVIVVVVFCMAVIIGVAWLPVYIIYKFFQGVWNGFVISLRIRRHLKGK